MKSRKMKWTGHVACMEIGDTPCKIIGGKLEGKRRLLKKIRCEDIYWIHLAQDVVHCRAVEHSYEYSI
jgi:hypothetical protein